MPVPACMWVNGARSVLPWLCFLWGFNSHLLKTYPRYFVSSILKASFSGFTKNPAFHSESSTDWTLGKRNSWPLLKNDHVIQRYWILDLCRLFHYIGHTLQLHVTPSPVIYDWMESCKGAWLQLSRFPIHHQGLRLLCEECRCRRLLHSLSLSRPQRDLCDFFSQWPKTWCLQL